MRSMYSSLFDYLKQKHTSALHFVDPYENKSLKWEEMSLNLALPESGQKRLAFLYLDNSLSGIRILLAFLESNHALCLLNNELAPELKKSLEEEYLPDYIFDFERNSGELPFFKEQKFSGYFRPGTTSVIHPDLKILLSTSGTTGSSKFVKLSDSNFISNTESILNYLPVSDADSCILNLPVHYSYGLSVLLTNIARGGKIVCSNETVISRDFWNFFKKYSCNSLAGVPFTYDMLIRIGFTKMNDLSLKYLTQAGGKLNEKNLTLFSEYSHSRGIPFFVMYGQTEATARMSYLPPAKLAEKPGSIGNPIKNGFFKINPDTNELIYTGPNVGNGYAETRRDLENCSPLPELHTGDLARVDEDNFFYLTGRIKRFIKLFGNRINLDELENDLKLAFECTIGCTGSDDVSLVVFSDNSSLGVKAIQDYIFSKYKIHPSVIRYKLLEHIPLTSSHKFNYQIIAEHYGR